MPKSPKEDEGGFYHVIIPLDHFHDGPIDESEVSIRPISEQEATTLAQLFREIGRNQVCPCGSGQKYKKCCLQKAN